jgi:hypothetical protein
MTTIPEDGLKRRGGAQVARQGDDDAVASVVRDSTPDEDPDCRHNLGSVRPGDLR